MDNLGVVMKLADKTAIVMTHSGGFVRVSRRPDMEVGMEVPLSVGRKKKRIPVWQRTGAAVAAAAIVLAAGAWFGIGQMGDDTAYAYVSVDINPSLAFTINQSQHVIAVTGLNRDGIALASELHVDHETLKAAVTAAIDKAVSKQMLPDEDTILVTAAPATNQADAKTVSQSVKADVQSALAANKTATQLKPHVYALQVSKPVWTAATKASVSPGKLASYLIAQQEGHNYSLSQLQGGTLGTVLGESSQASAVIAALKSNNTKQLETVVHTLQQHKKTDQNQPSVVPQNVVVGTPGNQLGKGVEKKASTPSHGHPAHKDSLPAIDFGSSNAVNATNPVNGTGDLANITSYTPQSSTQNNVTITIGGQTFQVQQVTNGAHGNGWQLPHGDKQAGNNEHANSWAHAANSNGQGHH